MLRWNIIAIATLVLAGASNAAASGNRESLAQYFETGQVLQTLAEASPSDQYEGEDAIAPSVNDDAPSQPYLTSRTVCAPVVPWRLADEVCGPCRPFEIGGWTQLGYHSRTIPLSRERDDLGSFQDQPHQVNLHQQWLWMERVAAPSFHGWDWGFRADVMYGIDAQKTQAHGNPGGVERGRGAFDASLDHGAYGWAIPQLYGEVAAGDWSIIAGHFFTLSGYETVPAPDNFFYSHSYTMYNSEPFTHTGVLATYGGVEGLELYMGWTLGWDTGFDQLDSGSNWLGGFSTQLTDDVVLTYISTYGNFGRRDGGGNGSYQHSLVFDVALADDLNYVLQSDLVDVDAGNIPLNDTIGINQYLFYEVNDFWAVGTRMEWWKADGTSFYGLTYGLNYRPHANLVVRPEVRHDWSPGEDSSGDFNQTAVGIDMILTY